MRYAVAGVLLMGLVGCSDASPEAQIRSLIPEAASISNADFDALAKTESPRPDAIASQSLSLVLFALDPVSAAKAQPSVVADFQYLSGGFPNPADLAEVMSRSKQKGYATMLQPPFIEKFDCQPRGPTAVGTVSFKAPGLYQGKVEFTASFAAASWRIDEFRLPNYRLRVSRDAGGRWKKYSLDAEEAKLNRSE